MTTNVRPLRSAGWTTFTATLLGVLGLFMLTACSQPISDKDVDKHQVSVAEVKRLLDLQRSKGKDDVIVLLDTRPPAEFAKGHIPGARNLQLSQVKPKGPRDAGLERYKNIIVYGQDGSSAAPRALVKRMMELEYENVAMMAGGLYQWRVTGGAIEGTESK
ncbi:MAG TPA: rhodanese-like domain-containing protein [Phycisphaerales bacterium]|nr:rhodanese-like domain-containing protein [Phycisphaerales bacterium]